MVDPAREYTLKVEMGFYIAHVLLRVYIFRDNVLHIRFHNTFTVRRDTDTVYAMCTSYVVRRLL